MNKLPMQTPNLADENFAKLQALFPNAVTEVISGYDEAGKPIVTRAIDKDVLMQAISTEVVDGPRERYQFTWPDKKKSVLLANAPIQKTLRPCREESVDFDHTENLYIEGDNLDVLKLLRETYLGKIKMIYIDPPYNTGNDFVYEDDFAESMADYATHSGDFDEAGNRLVKNLDSNGRFHTDWLNMIYPRLKLARDLLTDDGVIFISIDENEIYNLRKVCTEIFGEDRFVAQITLLCNPKGRSQDKYIANCHEYVLVYSNSCLPAGSLSIPKTSEEIKADYSLFDENGQPYRELELRNTHRTFGRFNRPRLWYPLYVKGDGSVSLSYVDNSEEVYPIWDDGFEGCWTWGKGKAETDIHLLVGRKTNGKTKIYRKAYAYDNEMLPLKQVKSIWNDNSFFTEKGQIAFNALFETKEKVFQSPKSVSMLMQCLRMSQSKDAIILDFFSGSATTAHAVMQLNAEDGGKRKFIMVQLPEETDEKSEAFKAGYKNICEIGKERIRRAGNMIIKERADLRNAVKSGAFEKQMAFAEFTSSEGARQAQEEEKRVLDVGFRVLKLDSTNMKPVYYKPGDYTPSLFDSLTDNIKEDRTAEDLLFQVMLERGVLPSSKIEEKTIGGKRVFFVAGNYLVACFDAALDEATITAIAKTEPYYFVTRESSLATDSAKTNLEQLFKTYSPTTEWWVM